MREKSTVNFFIKDEGRGNPPFFIMTKFYLDQLTEVSSDPPENLSLSKTTIELCLAALMPATDRSNWVQDLQELDDTEWGTATGFVTTAIEELSSVF